MLFLLALTDWQVLVFTQHMLFLLASKDWQVVVLTKKTCCFYWHWRIDRLTSAFFEEKIMLFLLALEDWQVFVLTKEMLLLLALTDWRVVVFTQHMLFLLALKDWQGVWVVLTKQHVVSIGTEGLTDWQVFFFWRKNMLFLLALKDWQVFVLTKKCCYFWHWLTYK